METKIQESPSKQINPKYLKSFNKIRSEIVEITESSPPPTTNQNTPEQD